MVNRKFPKMRKSRGTICKDVLLLHNPGWNHPSYYTPGVPLTGDPAQTVSYYTTWKADQGKIDVLCDRAPCIDGADPSNNASEYASSLAENLKLISSDWEKNYDYSSKINGTFIREALTPEAK